LRNKIPLKISFPRNNLQKLPKKGSLKSNPILNISLCPMCGKSMK